jgi:hypothetical protein
MEKTYATVLLRTVIETTVTVEFPATDDPDEQYDRALDEALKLLPELNHDLEQRTELRSWQRDAGWTREVIPTEIPTAGELMPNGLTWAPGDIVETYDEPLTWRGKSRS